MAPASKTVVLNVVGLTSGLIGPHTPFLKKWTEEGSLRHIQPVIPAVTCTAQATYLTGTYPDTHGIVANGWYFQEEAEVKLWRQSNRLVQGEKLWDIAKKQDPTFTCANMFWWYNMYSTVDYSVTPRPMYPADGRKIPDIYTFPATLRNELQDTLGQFPLFKFWGPATSIEVSEWIAQASIQVDTTYDPTLTLIYLPHLDYNCQRYGPEHPSVFADLKEIDAVCESLITYYENQGANVIVLSEYGITGVDHPVHINRILREAGHIAIREERGLELLDAGASRAFAMADHQIAHVYVKHPADIPQVKQLLEQVEGIAQVLDHETKSQYNLDHPRSGELVALSTPNAWFTYYYWLEDNKAPDFARTVDIHRKPGYDPVEMFLNPKLWFPKLTVIRKLLMRKLGFRVLMDVIPLDASLIGGSHGHLPSDKKDWPVLAHRKNLDENMQALEAHEVFSFLLSSLNLTTPSESR